MQTHKNPTLRQGPAPFKAPTSSGGGLGKPPASVDKPPSFVRDGKKWLIVRLCFSFVNKRIEYFL